MVFTSNLPDVEIPTGISITDFTLRMADELGDKPAIIDGPSGRTQSYAELKSGIQLLAGGLAARGFGPGHTLGLMAPTFLSTHRSFMARPTPVERSPRSTRRTRQAKCSISCMTPERPFL